MFNWFQYETKTIKIGYEDFLYILKNPDQYNIISTLSAENQECLIKNTLSIQNENYIFESPEILSVEEETYYSEVFTEYTMADVKAI